MVKSCTYALLSLLIPVVLSACKQGTDSANQPRLFQTISAEESGLTFINQLTETVDHNYYKYMYTYIGGGVAAGDFDNDGKVDLFFVSNVGDNKLYLNAGNFKFNDISQQAGIVKRPGFDAGVALADVNNDGWLDIYITRGGWNDADGRFANMLYINQGKKKRPDGTEGISFLEQAKDYHLDDANRGIQSTFFDYDRDGDLDVFVSNAPDFDAKGNVVIDLITAQTDAKTIALKGSDHLYRNEGNNTFKDVSLLAGIKPDIGFGLNPQVGDLNNDGWLDVYVCNDFRIPDFAYLNNKDGTFHEGRNELVRHMSFNSMGSDIADLNNDGLFDLYTLDMNPEDYVRSKTTMSMTDPALFAEMVTKDYNHQYMHNMLQISNGDGSLSEVANMAGVANTDWSWSSLIADFDLDGFNDLYVTNGVFRDVIDRDKNNEILASVRQKGVKPTDKEFLDYARMLPQQKLANYFFRNRGDLTFENVSSAWTDSVGTFSNGAVYADLDNDGDLDIVVNNINDPATLLKNTAVENKTGNFVRIKLVGSPTNQFGVGTTVTLHQQDGSLQTRQFIPSRGFLSSMSEDLYFGLGNKNKVVKLSVVWPDGKRQELAGDVPLNAITTLNYAQAGSPPAAPLLPAPLFREQPFPFAHTDPAFDDFQKQLLLPHKLSQTGPGVAVGDVNKDGRDDIYLGGGHLQAGQLLLADASGSFQRQAVPAFDADKLHEDTGACFFDADKDGDLDLYVVSGSYEFDTNSELLIDRLYLNDGSGHFQRSEGLVPEIPAAGSVVVPADFDGDGDVDLFVGGRVLDGQYPYAPPSFLLQNQGGKFSVVTSKIAPQLRTIGMVTDAVWADMDNDKDLDLVVTGEWMGIEVFENKNGAFAKSEKYADLSNAKGWWNKLKVVDTDGDGDLDILAGNLGLNYKFHASPEKPFSVYAGDFDASGTVDIILAKQYRGSEVPIRGKSCTSQQLPQLASKINSYHDFASKNVEGIIGPELKNALHYEVTEFRSGLFVNEGGTKFQFKPFNNQAQQSPVNSILFEDFDQDGIADLLLAGNNYGSEIETTRADAGNGVFLKGLRGLPYKYIPNNVTGFYASKDVRHMLTIGRGSGQKILVINNDGKHSLFSLNHPNQ